MLEDPRELLLLALAPLEPPPPLNALELPEPRSLDTLRFPTRSPPPEVLALAFPPSLAPEPVLSRMAACSVLPVPVPALLVPAFCRLACVDWF